MSLTQEEIRKELWGDNITYRCQNTFVRIETRLNDKCSIRFEEKEPYLDNEGNQRYITQYISNRHDIIKKHKLLNMAHKDEYDYDLMTLDQAAEFLAKLDRVSDLEAFL